MQRNDPDATPRISRFADRLARRATMVANAREGYATTLHAHDCDMLFVPVAGRFDIEMLEVAKADSDDSAAWCGALIMEAARLCANPLLQEHRTPARLIAELLADYIQTDLSRALSLEVFAARHRLSRRQVERIFRSEFGLSPLEFQQSRRVERARFLLESTEDSVLSVAQQVGWESGSYLSRVLNKTWARTAAEIRASGRAR